MQMFESIESEEDKVKYLEYFYDYISRSCDGIKLASRLTIRDEIIEVEKQEKLVELNSNLF